MTSKKCLVVNLKLAGGKAQGAKQNKPPQANNVKSEMPPTPGFVSYLNAAAAAANAAGVNNVGGLGHPPQTAVHPLFMAAHLQQQQIQQQRKLFSEMDGINPKYESGLSIDYINIELIVLFGSFSLGSFVTSPGIS